MELAFPFKNLMFNGLLEYVGRIKCRFTRYPGIMRSQQDDDDRGLHSY